MKKIETALSNDVYWDQNKNVIIKKYSQDKFKRFFGNREFDILSRMGYNPSSRKRDEIEIPYIEHENFNDDDISIQDLTNVVKALHQLHNMKAPKFKESGFEKSYYKFLLKGNGSIKGYYDEEEKYVSDKAFQILKKGKQVLLHNDLVKGNLLKTGREIKLIDFEYSVVGNPIFDVASFITERKLTKSQLSFFMDCYDNKLDKQDLLIVSAFLQIFWARWALFKFKSTDKKIYKDIANIKFKAYKKITKRLFI